MSKERNGIQRRRSNLLSGEELANYSGSAKNTLKSRIMSMDKGWIKKNRTIKKMNRTSTKLSNSIVPMSGITGNH